jgi:signal transduction histidine kinase
MSPGRTGSDPAEALLRRTRIRLATVTLLVVTALVVAVGVTTLLTATTLMRQSVDRTLDQAVAGSVSLHDLFEGESEDGYAGPLGDADTFLLLVTADGQVLGSTTTADLTGLPDQAALQAAVAGGDDRRDGTYGGADMRLLTTRVSNVDVEDDEGGVAGGPIYAQAGFNLALQNRLERQLAIGIAIVSVLGIIGAVIVTLVITSRALVPIREAFAAERRFVAAASHELQTPTSIIRASAEILEREHLVRADGITLVEDIINETDRLGRLVADLLALSSLEAGAASLDVRTIDVAPWFEDVARRARSITESHGLRFSSSHPVTQPITVQADRDRLDQIVLILVDNAVNHSPPGGEVGLDLAVDLRARTATAVVRDEGPGIPAEDVERIFEPFMRGNGRRRSSGGAGLGLAIARQLTGRLGAELTVASTPGSGATFRLSLPLARADKRSAATPGG